MNEPFVVELRTGKVKQLGKEDAKNPMERKWETGMFKKIRTEEVWLTETGLQADEVADTKNHGGVEKALFAYPVKHYDYWQETNPKADMRAGGMGENLVMTEADEQTICIGDIFEFGDAIIQVSQPRQPCWKPARRYQVLDLALQIQQSGLTGWYFRVVKEGNVSGQAPMKLVERIHPGWTIAKCNHIMHEDKGNLDAAQELMELEALAPNWKRTLEKRLRGRESSIERRVYGKNVDDD